MNWWNILDNDNTDETSSNEVNIDENEANTVESYSIEQISEFFYRLNTIYNDMSLRINTKTWKDLLKSDVIWNKYSFPIIEDKIFNFLINHKYLPANIWAILNNNFNWSKNKIKLYDKYSKPIVDVFLKNLKASDNLKYDYLGSINSELADKYLYLRQEAYEAIQNKYSYKTEKSLFAAYDIYKHDPELLKLIGSYYYDMGDFNKALDFYREVVEINNYDLESALLLGDLLIANMRFSEAIPYYKLCLYSNQDDENILKKIGYCYYYTDNLLMSKESFQRLLNFQCDNKRIKKYLDNIESKLKGNPIRTIKLKNKEVAYKDSKIQKNKQLLRKGDKPLAIIMLIVVLISIFALLWVINTNNTVTTTIFDDNIKPELNPELNPELKTDLEPKVIVAKYLDNVRKLDVSKAAKYTVDNTSNFEKIKQQINKEDKSIAHYNTFYKKMMDYDYEVGDTEINENTASVQITLKTYNFTTAIMDARLHITDSTLANEISERGEPNEKIAQKELSKILDPMKRKLEISLKLTLTKTENGWRIDNDCIKGDLNHAIVANVANSIEYYCEYYKDPSKYDGSISMDSYNKFLESKGIIYDENSKISPFEKEK